MLAVKIVSSLEIVNEMKIPDFDVESFKRDVELCFEQIIDNYPNEIKEQ